MKERTDVCKMREKQQFKMTVGSRKESTVKRRAAGKVGQENRKKQNE